MNSARLFARKNFLSLATVGTFLIAISEMIFMGGPFAAYFYSIYSPVLTWTESRPYLVWLNDFFILHLSTPRSAWFANFVKLPRYLLHLGGALFVVHAVYLYWMKLVRKEVATDLLYRYIRHPQYLSFSVAGLGLVFHWPRFINLLLFFVMLFGYYALARNEEQRMERQYGDVYRVYKEQTAMFFPGRVIEKTINSALGWLPTPYVRGYVALFILLVAGLASSVLLRAGSVQSLHYEALPKALVIFLEEPAGVDPKTIENQIARISAEDSPQKGTVRLFYVLSDKGTLRHLLVDSGVTYEGLKRGSLPEGAWYLVRASASYCSADT